MAGTAGAPSRSDLAHLYRRAAFGARPDELDRAVADGYAPTVERLLSQLDQPTSVPFTPTGKPDDAHPLVPWWIELMVATATPVREKLTLFWHGHFATSNAKVRDQAFMAQQNDLFRRLGAGPFEALANAVVKDPAMLKWLDGNTNQKAHPNENLARELMELFTLGVGNYSETDVQQAARCLTGWRVKTGKATTLLASQHDDGTKTVLGQTGDFGADDLVRILVQSDTSARFVAARVYSHFARPVATTDPVVADLAHAFVAAGRDVTALLRAVFMHPDFLSPATRSGLVKTPVEWAVGMLRAVGGKPNADIATVLNGLGQLPFYPPNVGGWGQNLYWLSTAASLVRLDFAASAAPSANLAALTSLPKPQRVAAAAKLLSIDGWSASTAAALGQALDSPRMLFALAVTSPEYLLA